MYEELNIRKNKFTIDNYTIELYMREVRKPLTPETLGKYLYKFYFNTKVINDKEDEESRKKNANYLMLKHVDKERYIEDKLPIRAIKKGKKKDYSNIK